MAASTAQGLSDGSYPPSPSCCSIAIALNERPGAINLGGLINKPGGAMSDEQLKSELERLRNENAALKKGRSRWGVRMKVSEKGDLDLRHGTLSGDLV